MGFENRDFIFAIVTKLALLGGLKWWGAATTRAEWKVAAGRKFSVMGVVNHYWRRRVGRGGGLGHLKRGRNTPQFTLGFAQQFPIENRNISSPALADLVSGQKRERDRGMSHGARGNSILYLRVGHGD